MERSISATFFNAGLLTLSGLIAILPSAVSGKIHRNFGACGLIMYRIYRTVYAVGG